MRRLQPSWAILLLIGAVCSLLSTTFIILTKAQGVVEAGMDLPNARNAPQDLGTRMEHLVSGIDGIQGSAMERRTVVDRAQSGGVDAGALLNSIAQGQEKGESGTKAGNIGGDIANQIAGGGSPGIGQIIDGLTEQNQAGAKNQSTSPARDQTKENAPLKGQDATNAQNGGGQGLAIQIEQTTVTEANGQQIKTERVKEVGTPSLAAVQSILTPSSMAPELTEGKPAATPAAVAESLAQAKNGTTAVEAVKPTPNAHSAQSLAETSKVVVGTDTVMVLVVC
jgi:hypothetical protein